MRLGVRALRALGGHWWLAVACVLSAACNDDLGYWLGDPVVDVNVNASPPSGVPPSAPQAWAGAAAPAPADAAASSPGDMSAAPASSSAPAAPLPPPPMAAAPSASGLACASIVPPASACPLGNGAMLPSEVSIEQENAPVFFAAGAVLPAGNYRLEYVGGCLSLRVSRDLFNGIDLDQVSAIISTLGDTPVDLVESIEMSAGWTVHGSADVTAEDRNVFVLQDGIALQRTPGTPRALATTLTYPSYAECVAANCIDAGRSVDFYFTGGTMSVRYMLSATAAPFYSFASGALVGGRGPSFRLTRLDACVQ